jgi:hypothetical protein
MKKKVYFLRDFAYYIPINFNNIWKLTLIHSKKFLNPF